MWGRTLDGLARPEPQSITQAMEVTAKTDRKRVLAALQREESVVITDQYSTGLAILADLKKELSSAHSEASFGASRRFRSAYHEISRHLLVPIRDGEIALRKAPTIGWLATLYPDIDAFCLSFSQVQGLNSSWQWWSKGIQYPVLEHAIHPFYATYFPTRFDHLELFDEWLIAHSGSFQSTVDVGTGCGVLTFQLLRRGANEVWATDTNPNAIASVREDLKRTQLGDRVQLAEGDLFAGFDGQADLIVLNPPWLPGDPQGPMDAGIYYAPGFFERFFEAAADRLSKAGRLVILFSSLGSDTFPDVSHPVEAELEQERFREVECLRRTVAPASKKTKRQKATRQEERVELWVLAGK